MNREIVLKKRLEKIFYCGDTVEYIRYVNPIPVEHREYTINKNKEKNEGKREDNLFRARADIRRYIWTNATKYTKFVTLTYKEPCLDFEQLIYDFKQFIKKLRRKGFKCPYLWISEHQKERGLKENNKGSLHIHCLLFVDDFIHYDIINKCWGKGNTDIHRLKDVKNLGAYVCKYLTKEEFEEYHKHCYHISRDIKKPVCFCNDGYIGTYLIYQGLLNNIDFKFSNTTEFSFIAPNGEIIKNSFIYQQGIIKDES